MGFSNSYALLMPVPALLPIVSINLCHNTDQIPSHPFGLFGRTWRLRAKVRTSHFERLESYSKKRGADNATDQVLPYPRRGPWQDLALTRHSPNEPF